MITNSESPVSVSANLKIKLWNDDIIHIPITGLIDVEMTIEDIKKLAPSANQSANHGKNKYHFDLSSSFPENHRIILAGLLFFTCLLSGLDSVSSSQLYDIVCRSNTESGINFKFITENSLSILAKNCLLAYAYFIQDELEDEAFELFDTVYHHFL